LLIALEGIFESDSVYQLPFAQELSSRLGTGSTEQQAQEFIGETLIRGLGDKVSFSSLNVMQERVCEAYFINTQDSANNLLHEFLQKREAPPGAFKSFFNTCSNDMAESLWLYPLTEDNLAL
jgi:hypothetical protein